MRVADRDAPTDATRVNRPAARRLGQGVSASAIIDVYPLQCRQNRFAGESHEYSAIIILLS